MHGRKKGRWERRREAVRTERKEKLLRERRLAEDRDENERTIGRK